MRIIELNSPSSDLEAILEAAEREDIVIARDGHAQFRIEKLTDEDLEDWLFEHDPKVIREAEAAKERLRQGTGISLEDLRRELGI